MVCTPYLKTKTCAGIHVTKSKSPHFLVTVRDLWHNSNTKLYSPWHGKIQQVTDLNINTTVLEYYYYYYNSYSVVAE